MKFFRKAGYSNEAIMGQEHIRQIDYLYKGFYKGLSKCKNWKDMGIYLADFFGTQPSSTNPYKHTFKTENETKMNLIKILFTILILVVFGFMTIDGIDKAIENQDIMLCNSAKISGNREYLKKCECFYSGESIKCLQKQK